MEDENYSPSFLGKGWSFPPTFSRLSNSVEMRTGSDDIKESLIILLSTLPGERKLNPKFGCDLSILLFETMSISLQSTLSNKIEQAILAFEPRITLENIEYKVDRGQSIVYINLIYIIRTTNTRMNMVYPYYLKEGTEL